MKLEKAVRKADTGIIYIQRTMRIETRNSKQQADNKMRSKIKKKPKTKSTPQLQGGRPAQERGRANPLFEWLKQEVTQAVNVLSLTAEHV